MSTNAPASTNASKAYLDVRPGILLAGLTCYVPYAVEARDSLDGQWYLYDELETDYTGSILIMDQTPASQRWFRLPAVTGFTELGYASVYCPSNKWVLVCNQFVSDPANPVMLLSDIVPEAPDGTEVYFWDPVTQDLSTTVPVKQPWGWTNDVPISVGQAFFINASADFTNYFCGYSYRGSLTSTVHGSSHWNAIGGNYPSSDHIATILGGYTPSINNNDLIWKWDVATQDFVSSPDFYSFTWQAWSTLHTYGPCEGFFLEREGPSTTWVRSYGGDRPGELPPPEETDLVTPAGLDNN